jgi:hypothetical protein
MCAAELFQEPAVLNFSIVLRVRVRVRVRVSTRAKSQGVPR